MNSTGITTMNVYQELLQTICSDPQYLRNLDWGEPRRGHPEGTIRAHIRELEQNLKLLKTQLTGMEHDRLRVMIHTHDTFKAESKSGVPITDPRSHASLARSFLAEFCDDEELLMMIQYHDEPYSLYLQQRHQGVCRSERVLSLINNICDWNMFVAFCIIDGCTQGKSRDPLVWFIEYFGSRVDFRWNLTHIC